MLQEKPVPLSDMNERASSQNGGSRWEEEGKFTIAQEQWSLHRYGRGRDGMEEMVALRVTLISPIFECAYLRSAVGINSVSNSIAK